MQRKSAIWWLHIVYEFRRFFSFFEISKKIRRQNAQGHNFEKLFFSRHKVQTVLLHTLLGIMFWMIHTKTCINQFVYSDRILKKSHRAFIADYFWKHWGKRKHRLKKRMISISPTISFIQLLQEIFQRLLLHFNVFSEHKILNIWFFFWKHRGKKRNC